MIQKSLKTPLRNIKMAPYIISRDHFFPLFRCSVIRHDGALINWLKCLQKTKYPSYVARCNRKPEGNKMQILRRPKSIPRKLAFDILDKHYPSLQVSYNLDSMAKHHGLGPWQVALHWNNKR